MSFGGSTKQVPTQTPYFQQLQQLLATDALGVKAPTMPSIFGTAGPVGSGGGGAGSPGGGATPYNASPISFSQGPPGGGVTSGSSPYQILMSMLSTNAPGGGVAGGGSVGATPGGTAGPGGVSLNLQPSGFTGQGSGAETAATNAGQNPAGPGGVGGNPPGFLNQIFNPGAALPAGSIPSLDSILQTETGANSAFTNTILPALTGQFNQANAESAAAAKESAGNLTGSGFANTLGTALGRNAATEGASVAQLLAQLGQAQAGTENEDLLAQYGAQNTARAQNANSFAQLMQMIFGGGQANTVVTPGWSSGLGGLLSAAGSLGGAAITAGANNNNSGG